jgi:ribosomal protein L7/L12
LVTRIAVNIPGVPVQISRKARREADRRAGEAMASLLDPAGRAEVDQFLACGKPIMAIKRVRELTGLRLNDAKRVVESIQH